MSEKKAKNYTAEFRESAVKSLRVIFPAPWGGVVDLAVESGKPVTETDRELEHLVYLDC